MEQGHYTALCRYPRHTKTVITGPTAGPATEDPASADKVAIPPADTGSPATEAPATVLPTHTQHLTTQRVQEKPYAKVSPGQSHYI